MQSVSSRIWTRVAVFISYDDNNYTTGTFYLLYCTFSPISGTFYLVFGTFYRLLFTFLIYLFIHSL